MGYRQSDGRIVLQIKQEVESELAPPNSAMRHNIFEET